jgi:hypothetical protein
MRHLSALSLIFAMACSPSSGDDAHAGHEHETGEDGPVPHATVEEACTHAELGPFVDVTAAADAMGAPDATREHSLVRIALVNVMDGKGGTVTYAADEAGEYAIFATNDTPLTIAKADGTAVTVEESIDIDDCTEVAKAYMVDLEIGTYTIALGPTTEMSVGLVIEHLKKGHNASHRP